MNKIEFIEHVSQSRDGESNDPLKGSAEWLKAEQQLELVSAAAKEARDSSSDDAAIQHLLGDVVDSFDRKAEAVNWKLPAVIAASVLLGVVGTSIVLRQLRDKPIHNVVETSTDGMVQISQQPGASVWVRGPGKVEHNQNEWKIEFGNVYVQGDDVHVRALNSEMRIHGASIISVEPFEHPERVTPLFDHTTGETMISQWMKWGAVPVAAAAIGSALTVWAVQGTTNVTSEAGNKVAVAEGRSFSSGKPADLAVQKGTALSKSTPSSVSAALLARGADADLQTMTKEQLIATATQLRNEKEDLLKNNAKPKDAEKERIAALEKNNYRDSPELLAQYAKNGTLRIHTPLLNDQAYSIPDKVKAGTDLSPEEIARVTQIYRDSQERVRKGLVAIYTQIGGNASLAAELSPISLYQDIVSKSPESPQRGEAARILAKERAGLLPNGSAGVQEPTVNMMRMLFNEEDRFFTELDNALGPRRAEEFVNAEGQGHHTHSWSSGPAGH